MSSILHTIVSELKAGRLCFKEFCRIFVFRPVYSLN